MLYQWGILLHHPKPSSASWLSSALILLPHKSVLPLLPLLRSTITHQFGNVPFSPPSQLSSVPSSFHISLPHYFFFWNTSSCWSSLYFFSLIFAAYLVHVTLLLTADFAPHDFGPLSVFFLHPQLPPSPYSSFLLLCRYYLWSNPPVPLFRLPAFSAPLHSVWFSPPTPTLT